MPGADVASRCMIGCYRFPKTHRTRNGRLRGPSGQCCHDFAVFSLAERAKRLCLNCSGSRSAEGHLRGSLVVWCLADRYHVVLTHDEVELGHPAASSLERLLGRVEPSGALLDVLGAFVSPTEQ